MTYKLHLTVEDIRTIAFVGHRYSWLTELGKLVIGDNFLSEPEAWELREAFDADTEGGHSMFPMLAPDSALCAKLLALYEEIV